MAYVDSTMVSLVNNKMTKEIYEREKALGNIHHDTENYEITDLVDVLNAQKSAIDTNSGDIEILDGNIEDTNTRIDNIEIGKTPVGLAEIAHNLSNSTLIPIEDVYGARITAKNDNEVISGNKDKTTSAISELGGFTVKQVLQDSEASKLTTITPFKILGDTLKQIVKNGNFVNTSGWSVLNGTFNVASNIATLNGTNTNDTLRIIQNLGFKGLQNQKFYIRGRLRTTTANVDLIRILLRDGTNGNVYPIDINNPVQNQWYDLKGLITLTANTTDSLYLFIQLQNAMADGGVNGCVLEVDGNSGILAIPLTELGLDTTLTTTTLFEQRYPNLTYFEGLKSVKPKSIISKSNNLIDNNVSKWALGALDAGSGLESVSTIRLRSGFIDIKSSSTYSRATASGYKIAIYEYDINKNWINFNAFATTTITTLLNTKFIRVVVAKNDDTAILVSDISNVKPQLNEGSTALPYQTYLNETTNIASEIQALYPNGLGRLPNGVVDEIYNGSLIKRVALNTYNGSSGVSGITALTNVVRCQLTLTPNGLGSYPASIINNSSIPLSVDYNGDTKHYYLTSTNVILFIPKTELSTYDLAGIQAWLNTNNLIIMYEINPTSTPIALTKTINAYDNPIITVDNDWYLGNNYQLVNLYKYNCIQNHKYYVKAITTNGKIQYSNNGVITDIASLSTSGDVYFTSPINGDCWLSYLKDGLATVKNAQWITISEMSNTPTSLEKCRELFYSKQYPYGLTNSKPYKLISVGDNLFDYKHFYNTLKAVNSANIVEEVKDGRNCIKITNPNLYSGIKLYQGMFAPNVQYKFRVELLKPQDNNNLYMDFVYTDNTTSACFRYGATANQWFESSFVSQANKTIDYLLVTFGSAVSTGYINIDKFMLQMNDNPTTEYLPYIENTLLIPQKYLETNLDNGVSYGIPSLANNVRDRFVKMSDKWYWGKFVGHKKFNGSEEWSKWGYVNGYVRMGITVNNGLTNGMATSNIFSYGQLNGSEDIYMHQSSNSVLQVVIHSSRLVGFNESLNDSQVATLFKNWLTANNLEVIYQLAQPILTEIPNFDSNIVIYNYGRELLVDSNGIITPTFVKAGYYMDAWSQIITNKDNIANILTRLAALEALHV